MTFESVTRDLLAVCGAALCAYGAGLAYRPAGFMVGGALLLAVSLIGTLRKPK